ncbi:SGNH/GDSL hydrolase family protein [Roseiconus lacunae]|uniref:SGNH/GDSL hydrolase family protein n=1 Tax=Roseiconus lacunae TaxID=2605694 RepID=UPI001E429287|nr:SGNH/GDSL hydrolase family protein [Roseiconus lacunae]MCD0459112.1 SGNH/GDSL hydrolase family protein [Roseiconus lacunae]
MHPATVEFEAFYASGASAGQPATGLSDGTLTASVSSGGSYANLDNQTFSEVKPGRYQFALSSSERAGSVHRFACVSSDSAVKLLPVPTVISDNVAAIVDGLKADENFAGVLNAFPVQSMTLTRNGGHHPDDWSADTSVSEGTSGSGRTFWQDGNIQRIRRSGFISQIRLQTAATHDVGALARLKIMRAGTVVETSETFKLTDDATTSQTIELVSPVPVEVGDVVGIYIADVGSGVASGLTLTTDAGQSVKFATGEIADDSSATTLAGYSLNLAVYGTGPKLAITGDSIAEGHNGPTDYHGFFHSGNVPGGNEASEIGYAIKQILGASYGYENHARGSQTFAWVRSTGIPSAIDSRAKSILIHCGVNDVAQGREWSAIEDDLDAIRDLVPSTTALFINEILPWSDGSDGQAATVRTWNANLATWCAANDATLILCHDAMGQTRGTTGELDDLLTAYDQDGVHLTEAGVSAIAGIIAAAIMRSQGVNVTGFSPPASSEIAASGGSGAGTDVNIVSVAGQPVNSVEDFKSKNVFRVPSPSSPEGSIGKAKFNIPDHLRGDTWAGFANALVADRDGNPVDLTGATIRMEVKSEKDVKSSNHDGADVDAAIEFSTSSSTIEVSNATNGLFSIPKRVVDLTPRDYVYDIQVELANGDVHTVLFGTWKIAQDVTR